MSFLLGEHYRTARQSLNRARLRTTLTMLGVAIGVASITAVLALESGVNRVLNTQVTELGESVVIVRPQATEPSLLDLSNPTPSTAYSTSPIEERDIESLQELENIEFTAPLMTIAGSVRTNYSTPDLSTIVATTPEFINITPLTISDGQFIDEQTRENTAVIGTQLSIDMFGSEQSVGQRFYVRGQPFTVIGVIERQNQPINYNNIDIDHAAFISFESGKLFNSGVAQIQQINLKASGNASLVEVKSDIEAQLIKNHDNQRDTTVYAGREIAQPTSNLFQFISLAMAVVASISLVVGGVGIMNIMLVGVSERTREIGLRKAVGASNGTIVSQFVIESLIISIIGGLFGFMGGYLIAFLVSLTIPYDPSFSWEIAGWAAALSIGVGSVFGLYPAIRAARKDPIESLRRYR
jgi:putative ABC transport system permease protein